MARDVSKLFNKFVGKELLNPERTSADYDMTLQEMSDLAEENNLELHFHLPDQPLCKKKDAGQKQIVDVDLERKSYGNLLIKKVLSV